MTGRLASHPTLTALVALAGFAAVLWAQEPAVPTDSMPQFPRVPGRSLTGRNMTLPDDFEGTLNVVLIAFVREQQADVDTWTPFLRDLAARVEGLRSYELPTLSRNYRWVRAMIDGGMRGGIPDSAVRAATITLYIDKGPFRQALGIEDERDIQVLVVEPGGRVRGRLAGRFSPEQAARLEKLLLP